MLLPQSSAFAALKNRLNSVSSIGYLHIAPRPYVGSINVPSSSHSRQGSVAEAISSLQHSPVKASHDAHAPARSTSTTPGGPSFDRPNRLKGREDVIIRWTELLEKFRSVQERTRRAERHGDGDERSSLGVADLHMGEGLASKHTKEVPRGPPFPVKDAPAVPPVKPRSGLSRQFGRIGGAVAGRGKRAQQ